jgi:hypothetical protein
MSLSEEEMTNSLCMHVNWFLTLALMCARPIGRTPILSHLLLLVIVILKIRENFF